MTTKNIYHFMNVMYNYWDNDLDIELLALPPEAKFITGIRKTDAFLHHMLSIHGIDIKLKRAATPIDSSTWYIDDYNVVDEPKYVLFLLKWGL